MKESFFKCIRSDTAREVAKKPGVLMVLFHLALVTPRTGPEENKWIKIDYLSLGLTEAKFRTIKTYLDDNEQTTSRTTNKGTWLKLIGKTIFDINADTNNEQNNEQTTSLYIQEERSIDTSTRGTSEDSPITLSTITDQNQPPFQMVPAKVSLPRIERCELLSALIYEAGQKGRMLQWDRYNEEIYQWSREYELSHVVNAFANYCMYLSRKGIVLVNFDRFKENAIAKLAPKSAAYQKQAAAVFVSTRKYED